MSDSERTNIVDSGEPKSGRSYGSIRATRGATLSESNAQPNPGDTGGTGNLYDIDDRSPERRDDDSNRNINETSSNQIIIDESGIRVLRDEVRNTTNLESLMNLLKGNIGTGILALPSAFKYGGLWVSFVGIFVLGAISVHCMHLLVKCARHVCEKTGHSSLSYSSVVREAFKRGPLRFRKMQNVASVAINLFLCITQFGFCTVYILFVADNIRQVVEQFSDVRWNIRIYETLVALALLPYMFIRSLRVLSYTSLVSNIVMAVGLTTILIYCFIDLPSIDSRPASASWNTLPLYFGIAIYAFEGIGVVLPIENKMRTPHDLGGMTGVINLGMTIAVALYAAVGFYGYLKFGEDVKGSITLNLPPDKWYFCLVKMMFASAIFCTYAVQFYVPMEILWPGIQHRLRQDANSWQQKYGEYIMRSVFVVMTFALAAIIPCLDLVISLIGALSSSAVALIFPALLEIVTFWSEPNGMGRCHWKFYKDILIMCLGIVGFIVGTVTTLMKIISSFDTCSSN